jgi:hypothetical protein
VRRFDEMRLLVFDSSGQTLAGVVTDAISSRFVDAYNEPGLGEVEVAKGSPSDALLVIGAVVKVQYAGVIRFAWTVERRELDVLADTPTVRVSGRGILAWLEDAVVYPQGTLAQYLEEERVFNFAASDGTWENLIPWTNPIGVPWKDDTTARRGQPVGWTDRNAQWIWKTSPTGNVPKDTTNYFRREFTLTDRTTRIRFTATADNAFDLYLDGVLIMSSNDFDADAPTWTQRKSVVFTVPKGAHVLAAKVRNTGPSVYKQAATSASDNSVSISDHGLVSNALVKVTNARNSGLSEKKYYAQVVNDDTIKLRNTPGGSAVAISGNSKIDLAVLEDSTAGFLLSAWKVDSQNRNKTAIFRSQPGGWKVVDTNPKWSPAAILRQLVLEAQARGVTRLLPMGFDFTTGGDTENAPWTTFVATSVRVGDTLLSVMDEMVDAGIDFRVDPITLKLQAWERRGTNRTGEVVITGGDGVGGLTSASEPGRKTAALVRTRDGWTEKQISTSDRRETYFALGRIKDLDDARDRAAKWLNRISKNRNVSVQADLAPTTQCAPFVNFTVGDTVTFQAGSTRITARILSIAMESNQSGAITYSPELEII